MSATTQATDQRTIARPIRLRDDYELLRLLLIGCGGNGSHLAEAVARVGRLLKDQGRDVELTFFDPDHVDAGNIPRQNFAEAEIGVNKAQLLALRYSAKWGIPINAVPDYFDRTNSTHSSLTVLIGCVDNGEARNDISQSLPGSHQSAPNVWWLDLGNGFDTGQVILGSAQELSELQSAFRLSSVCTATPAPGLLHPELLRAAKTAHRQPQSPREPPQGCAQMALIHAQMPLVNQMTAAIGAAMLTRLLVTQDLQYWASYFDLSTGKQVSYATSPQAIEDALVNQG